MKILPPLLCLIALASPCPAQSESSLLPNPSFETVTEGRPKGWRVFLTPPETTGQFFVSAGSEGGETRTGAAALRFSFPDGAELSQAIWMADPTYGGMAVETGRYTCSFWIKAEDLQAGFHTWVVVTGYGEDKSRVGELGRSGYLTAKDLSSGEWTSVRFSFEVPEEGVARIAPSLIFKTDPSSSVNPVPGTMQILVDDLVILRE